MLRHAALWRSLSKKAFFTVFSATLLLSLYLISSVNYHILTNLQSVIKYQNGEKALDNEMGKAAMLEKFDSKEGSIVRLVPLLTWTSTNVKEELENVHINETSDGAPKYRFLRQQGLRPAQRLPDALIIGVKKSGTRALLEFIRLHPDVRAAGSEIHFFDRHYNRGFNWYRRRMPPTLEGQITMEKTPSYFITREVPARVKKMNPATRLLVVVRDPVTRAISDYTQAASKKYAYEIRRFEDMAFINGSVWGTVDTTWGPVRIGVYAHHLEYWLRYFPLGQMLFVSGERLIVDPAAEMARVQDFLGLKRVVTEKHFYFNATKGFPCLMKSEGRSTPHCLGKTKGRNHPHIRPTALERLREFYRPFNLRFYQLTGIRQCGVTEPMCL